MKVFECELPGPPRDVSVAGSLFRVHDDKEIDKEKAKSPAYNTKSAVDGKTQMNWDFELGKTFNLNHETGNPVLKVFVFSRKKSGFSNVKTPIGVVEVELDDLPTGPGTPEWRDLSRVDSAKGKAEEHEPGRVRLQVGFNRDVGEAPEVGAGEALTADAGWMERRRMKAGEALRVRDPW